MKNYREIISRRLSAQLEPNPVKRSYYRYLAGYEDQLEKVQLAQPALLARMEDGPAKLNLADLNQALEIGSLLADFGLPCDLFDEETYCRSITQDEKVNINDILSYSQFVFKSIKVLRQKALDGQLTPADIRMAAALYYHHQTLVWTVCKIHPVAHSPYRQK